MKTTIQEQHGQAFLNTFTQVANSFITWLMNDYQFDRDHDEYCGYINIGDGYGGYEKTAEYEFFVEHVDLFKPILYKLGFEFEKVDLEETIIHHKEKRKNPKVPTPEEVAQAVISHWKDDPTLQPEVKIYDDGHLSFVDSIGDDISAGYHMGAGFDGKVDFEMTEAVEKILQETWKPLRFVRIYFGNGDTLETNMASGVTNKEIREYYKRGTLFNVGPADQGDQLVPVTNIEILR
jgi:hypothetical protein